MWIWNQFWKAKAMKNQEKRYSQIWLFGALNLKSFLFDLGSILGSKNCLKIDIFQKNGGSKVVSEALLL